MDKLKFKQNLYLFLLYKKYDGKEEDYTKFEYYIYLNISSSESAVRHSPKCVSPLVEARDDCKESSVSFELAPGVYFSPPDEIEKSFSEMLIDYMIKNDLKNTDVYKTIKMDRKLFSKIISNKGYQPSRKTAISLCFALQLNEIEADKFLQTAGFSLSNSSKFDLIIRFFIRSNIYNIDDINQILYEECKDFLCI